VTRFEWAGLRRGDAVTIHLGAGVADPTRSATVLDTAARARTDNAVSFRVEDSGRIVWPARITVHQGATDTSCWRCAVAPVAPAPADRG
jgi:hypothetical protein